MSDSLLIFNNMPNVVLIMHFRSHLKFYALLYKYLCVCVYLVLFIQRWLGAFRSLMLIICKWHNKSAATDLKLSEFEFTATSATKHEANRNERRTSMRTRTRTRTWTLWSSASSPNWCLPLHLRLLRAAFVAKLFLVSLLSFALFCLRSTLWFAVDFLRTSSSCTSVRLGFGVVNTTCVLYTWQPLLPAAWGTAKMT